MIHGEGGFGSIVSPTCSPPGFCNTICPKAVAVRRKSHTPPSSHFGLPQETLRKTDNAYVAVIYAKASVSQEIVPGWTEQGRYLKIRKETDGVISHPKCRYHVGSDREIVVSRNAC